MRKWLIALGAGAVALAALLALTSTASAHARLKNSTPKVGEVAQTSPTQVAITFTEDIQKVSGTYDITVENAGGAPVTAGPAVIDEQDRSKLSVPLQASLPAGRYAVHYKNVSDADGDPFEGAFSFYVQVQPTAADLQADADLAKIGAEETTPGADTTPGAGETASPAATTSAAASPTAAAATPAATPSTSDSSSNNTGRNIGIAIGVIAVIAVVGLGGWVVMARR